MRKFFVFALMVCLLITSVANAGTKLKGKGLYDAVEEVGLFLQPSAVGCYKAASAQRGKRPQIG